MSRDKKEWNQNFKEYMEFIIKSKNYEGIPYAKDKEGNIKWIASAKTEIGENRKKWAESLMEEHNIKFEPGSYAKLMFEIHPTKYKPCQICGKLMSIRYVYPNKLFKKIIKNKFNIDIEEFDEINTIYDKLCLNNDKEKVKEFFIEECIEKNNEVLTVKSNWNQIEKYIEFGNRNGILKSLLSPGSMSNFPDRLDGFHTYNKCCRSTQDKGRQEDNMKTYNKDRRAYEYWSDGNIIAANKYMKSNIFKGNSADHIGPISLGFIHDPLLMQKMSKSDNSSKRDRLSEEDIEKLISFEQENNRSAINWYSKTLWKYIKEKYKELDNVKIAIQLKQSVYNFLYLLYIIKSNSGEEFLIENFLEKTFDEKFIYDYKMDKYGKILKIKIKNKTAQLDKERKRFYRIAIESIDNYASKENRNIKNISDKSINLKIEDLLTLINNKENEKAMQKIKEILEDYQEILIKRL